MNNRISILLLIVALCATTKNLFAQYSIGVRGGYVIGMANYEPAKYTKLGQGGYNFAATFTYSPDDEVEWTALQTELILSQRVVSYEISNKQDSVYSRSIMAVELPLLWRPSVSLSRGKGVFYAVLGPYIYYDLSSKEKYEDLGDPNSEYNVSRDWEYDLLRDNRLGVGVAGGLGIGWTIAPQLRLMAEARFVYGFSNILKPAAQYEGNPIQSTTSQINFTFGLSYAFNNKKRK